MSERYVQIEGKEHLAEEVIEKATDFAQREMADPNLSEGMKDAAVDAAVELINQVPPKP